MLQSETENNYCRTLVMSYKKRVGPAGDSHLQNLVYTFCQHFTENPLFIFNKIMAIIMSIPSNFSLFFYDNILTIMVSIPPTFPALMPFLELS